MSTHAHLYFIDETALKHTITQNLGHIKSFEQWLQARPDTYKFHHDYFFLAPRDHIHTGVRQVAAFSRAGWFPDRDEIAKHYPGLAHRLRTVSYFEYDGVRSPQPAYTEGSDFPTGYEGWLTAFNVPGWQFFSREEMTQMVYSVEEMLHAGTSLWSDIWREVILVHEASEYDLAHFLHEF